MTLNELLLEWSYRSEKGYPNVDSPSDISILKQILKQNNDIKSDLSDFIIFENSITTHPGTWGSLMEILYGYRGLFHPKNINIKKKEQIFKGQIISDNIFNG